MKKHIKRKLQKTALLLFSVIVALMLTATANAEASDDTAVSEEAETKTVVYDERSDQMEYGKRVAQLGKKAEIGKKKLTSSGYTLTPTAEYIVLCRTDGTETDFSQWGPTYTVAGPKDRYTLFFDTEEAAELAVAELSELEWIRYAERDAEVTASSSDSHSFFSWGAEQMNYSDYLDYNELWRSGSATVAIVDSGVYPHSFFSDRMTESGYDYIDADTDATNDGSGHGTNVAGILADCTDGAPVYIYPIRVLNDSNGGTISNLVLGISEAIDKGVTVINLSLESGAIKTALDDVILEAVDSGITVVTAAGNKSSDTSQYSPSHITDAGVVVVGAADSDGARASYSNYGDSVDLYAYGTGIVCCSNSGGYSSKSGTSMSAPHISGLAALLKLLHSDLSPAEVEYRICRGTVEAADIFIPDLTMIIPASMGFSLESLTLSPDETVVMPQSAFPATAEENITYTSSDASVIALESGSLVPVSEGSATVTASCFGFADTSFTVQIEQAENEAVLQIPAGTETLEDEAFYGVSAITDILLPDSLLSVGDNVFEGFSGLKTLTLPESITTVGQNSFSNAVLFCTEGSAAADYAEASGLSYILTPQE